MRQGPVLRVRVYAGTKGSGTRASNLIETKGSLVGPRVLTSEQAREPP